MPARTPAKKTTPAKKPAAKKAAPRASKPPPAAKKTKMINGELEAKMFETQAAHDTARADADRLRQQTVEKDDLLRLGQERIAALERELETARSAGSTGSGEMDQQLREMQSRLTTRQAELEAARAEAENLREAVAKTRAPGEAGSLRCPRCGAHMTEYTHEDVVRADRCDGCHGIFFDNGELEAVIKHHDEVRDTGKNRHWYSALFGKRPT